MATSLHKKTPAPSYILGQSSNAEFRLELLNEITSQPFLQALEVLPKEQVSILIIGCGSGHLETELSKMFCSSHFVGIDLSAKRIDETRAKTQALKCSNTFEYIQADLTSLPIQELETCDILISRFVLSHLPEPVKELNRLLPLVKPGGSICLEEGASKGSDYFCNTNNFGYNTFTGMVDVQAGAQESSFDAGFQLLDALLQQPGKLLRCHLSQSLLKSARHKSILRLGLEEAKSLFQRQAGEELVEKTISSLREFEEDASAFGLYMRFLTVIARKPG